MLEDVISSFSCKLTSRDAVVEAGGFTSENLRHSVCIASPHGGWEKCRSGTKLTSNSYFNL